MGEGCLGFSLGLEQRTTNYGLRTTQICYRIGVRGLRGSEQRARGAAFLLEELEGIGSQLLGVTRSPFSKQQNGVFL